MDLSEFYRLVIRNLPIVFLSTLLGLGTAGAITFATTPMYEAKIQLFVSTPSSALDISALVQGSSFSQQRVKSYAQIINSPSTLSPVIRQLALDTTAERLAKRVKASAPLDTVLINVTVTDESPSRSARIANAIGAQFALTANQIELSQSAASNAIKVTMVKSAFVPKSPATPKVPLNLLLGTILGFGLGVGLSILRQIFDNTIKNEEDLDGTPLLGVVGFDETATEKPLISQISRYASRTEAFRQLRTNLQYSRAENPPRVIAITSALPGEGKTSSSTNLAIALANTGFNTVIVEADMRRPKLNSYTGASEESAGLSELLSGRIEGNLSSAISKIIRPSGIVESLDLITSGKIPPNPSELLDSELFSELIEVLRNKYHFVILDCPPTLPVADATIISARVDGVLIVVKADSTRVTQFTGVRDSVTNVGGSVLGALINMIPVSRSYYDYGYKYGYGYGYGRKYGSYKKYGPYSANGSENATKPYAPQNTSH